MNFYKVDELFVTDQSPDFGMKICVWMGNYYYPIFLPAAIPRIRDFQMPGRTLVLRNKNSPMHIILKGTCLLLVAINFLFSSCSEDDNAGGPDILLPTSGYLCTRGPTSLPGRTRFTSGFQVAAPR